MHPVIYVGWVACAGSASNQLPFSMVIPDTVFVVLDDSKPGMEGMEIGQVLLFFLFYYCRKPYSCALIKWFVHDEV